MWSPLLRLITWLGSLTVLAGLLGLVYLIQERSRKERAAAVEPEPPKRAANKIIKLGVQLAKSHGLADEPAVAVQWVQRVEAYGRVVPNPKATAEVRTAFAGTLRADPEHGWPALGSWVSAGQVIGRLDIRVGPQERLDLLTKLNEARIKQKGADEHVRLQRERVERYEKAGKAISRAELDNAQKDFNEAKTQLAQAVAAVKEWQHALAAIDSQGNGKGKTWSQALTAPASGEVVELTGRPGMVMEPGGVVLRLVDFRFALVRLELPPEALTTGPPREVDLFTTKPSPLALESAANRPEPPGPPPLHRARLVGAAPQVEAGSQFASYWYEVDTAPQLPGTSVPAPLTGNWRPGLFVKALVEVPGARPQAGVGVPESSLLYHDGRALVYVRIGAGRYERREVRVLGRQQGRWVLAAGVEQREPVVSRRAQVLLSEEFRAEVDLD
jgi:multidrug efflux pump subunit AcrA (membrane-fusion protein)